MNLDAVALFWRNKQIGPLLTRLVWSVSNEQRQPGARLANQQFANELRSEKAGRAGDKDKFFTVHLNSGRDARTTRRPMDGDL